MLKTHQGLDIVNRGSAITSPAIPLTVVPHGSQHGCLSVVVVVCVALVLLGLGLGLD